LQKILRGQEKWLIAFSGGSDSTFLLAAAKEASGREHVLAVTAVSASLPAREREQTEALAAQIDVPHIFLSTHELENPSYASNPSNRCFFCKNELFGRLAPLAQERGMRLADGFNASDRSDYRPGFEAAQTWNVAHPLDEAHLTKHDIRVLSRWKKLSTWNKPASPCLSSRLPYGTPVTLETLSRVERAEAWLHAEAFRIVRVRHYGDRARIEVPLQEIDRLRNINFWNRLRRAFHAIGYSHIEIEERGFRSGRLNEALGKV
jgi:uncharacterized protein